MTEWLTLGIRRVVEIADDIFLKEKKDVCFVSRLMGVPLIFVSCTTLHFVKVVGSFVSMHVCAVGSLFSLIFLTLKWFIVVT